MCTSRVQCTVRCCCCCFILLLFANQYTIFPPSLPFHTSRCPPFWQTECKQNANRAAQEKLKGGTFMHLSAQDRTLSRNEREKQRRIRALIVLFESIGPRPRRAKPNRIKLHIAFAQRFFHFFFFLFVVFITSECCSMSLACMIHFIQK